MASYPTFITKDNSLTQPYHHFYYEITAPVFDWGKVYYYVAQEGLKAFIPIGVVFLNVGHKAKSFIVAKFPHTEGNKLFEDDLNRVYFKSYEDYASYMMSEGGKPFVPKRYCVANELRMRFETKESSCWYRSVVGYKVSNGINPYVGEMEIERLWLDGDGLHINFVENGKQFLNESEARKAMLKGVVDDFDFNEIPTTITEVEVSLSVKVRSVSADTAKIDVEDVLRKAGYVI